jgi:hypothetical protein
MSAKLKVTSNAFYTITACNDELREFKTLKQKDMWKKLHQKRCEFCSNASTIQMGPNKSIFKEGDANNYTNTKARIRVLNHIKRTFDSN